MMPPRASDQPESFFEDTPSEWARVKHAILGNYLRVFAYKLQRRSSRLWIVDGFAGAGRYLDESPGSPVIAARLNDDPGLSARGVEVRVIAIEDDAANWRSLQDALAPWTRPPQRAWVLPGKFSDFVADIVTLTAADPAFVFVDPFGMESVTIDELHPLLVPRIGAPLELLIRVSSTLLARFAGQVRAGVDNPARAGTAQAFAKLLSRMGMDPSWAADMLDESISREDRKILLLGSYAEAFQRRFKFVQYLPVRPSHGAAEKYFLLHATDSPHGYVKMNDVVAKLSEQQEVTREVQRRDALAQRDMFAIAPVRRVPDSEVDAVLLQSIRTAEGPPREFIEHRVTLVDHFGEDLREIHHGAALRRLERRGLVIVTRTPRGSSNLDRARVAATSSG